MVLPIIKKLLFSEILNLEVHQNRRIGSKITAILLSGWILPSGGVSLGRVCAPQNPTPRGLAGIEPVTIAVSGTTLAN